MSARVNPSELKMIARLTSQVKDISVGKNKYIWSNVHRLQAKDGNLTLFTNDGQVWLTWNLQLEEPTEDSYDVLVPANQFNDMASNSLDGLPYEISEEQGFLVLTQEPTQLRLREDIFKPYPEPRKSDSGGELQEWVIPSETLVQSFNFVIPFIDPSAADDQLTVLTWFPDNCLVGGSKRLVSCVNGLPSISSPLSFRQRMAKSIVAFVKGIEGEVVITLDGGNCIFRSPLYERRLLVATESIYFPRPRERAGMENDIFKIDGSRFRAGVSLLKSALPLDMNQLLITITGDQESAWLDLATSSDENQKSRDALPVMRDKYNPESPTTKFSISQRVLELALKEMKGSILEGSYYGPPERILHLEDERLSPTDMSRVVMIPVLDISGSPLNTKHPESPALESVAAKN